MTPEEKRDQMIARNKAICDYYKEGHKLREVASKFRLGRMRVLQILQAAGVWKPVVNQGRDQHLGVTVTKETKEALAKAAEENGESISKLSSDILEKAVR